MGGPPLPLLLLLACSTRPGDSADAASRDSTSPDSTCPDTGEPPPCETAAWEGDVEEADVPALCADGCPRAVTGGVTLDRTALADLAGLASLTTVGGNLSIGEIDPGMEFDRLVAVDGTTGMSLRLDGHANLVRMPTFPRLVLLPAYAEVMANDALVNLDGLATLERLTDLSLWGNPALQPPLGLAALAAVDGSLGLVDNGNVSVDGLDTLAPGSATPAGIRPATTSPTSTPPSTSTWPAPRRGSSGASPGGTPWRSDGHARTGRSGPAPLGFRVGWFRLPEPHAWPHARSSPLARPRDRGGRLARRRLARGRGPTPGQGGCEVHLRPVAGVGGG